MDQELKEKFLADFKLAMTKPNKEEEAKKVFTKHASFFESLQEEDIVPLETEISFLIPTSYTIVEVKTETSGDARKFPFHKIVAETSMPHIKLPV
ncbi:MAG: hypothetical protein WCT50_02580 [Patescibacteria group bacterium]|jgi:hypothetical protein